MHAVKPNPNETCDTDALHTLLRHELSAVETYDRAMERCEDQHVLADLHKIREEHAHAVVLLRDRVSRVGGGPTDSAEPWGAFAALARNGSHAVGPDPVLSALRQGEEYANNEQEGVLANENVNPECKTLVRTELLPRCREHVAELNRLMGGM